MKSSVLALATLVSVVANVAHADIIVCRQTEPFINETFDTEKGTVSVVTPENMNNPDVSGGLKFVIKGAGKFEIRTAQGALRRALTLNYDGSDGMSDLVYPFDGGAGINGSIGCESSELKAK